jgi:hypothetical protein
VGSAAQDLAVAEMCVHAARQRGLGADTSVGVHPVQK